MGKLAYLAGAAAAALGLSIPAQASTVVLIPASACVSVTASAGCLFDGNINDNPGGPNGYKTAEAAYNAVKDPDILLNLITSTDPSSGNPAFSTFGTITGAGTSSGTWNLPNYLVDFIAVKASNQFVLYKIGPASSGFWDTLDIPYNRNPHGLSHIVFFGTEIDTGVPEPTTWALMILGFGMIGGVMRHKQRLTARFNFA